MMNRRNILKLVAAGFGSSLVAKVSHAQGAYKPERFSGQTIRVLWPSDYLALEATVAFFPEFTQKTGIKVEVERIPYGDIKNRLLSKSASTQSEFDAFLYIAPWKTELSEKNYIADLGPLFKDASINDPTYDFEDLIPGYVVNGGLVGGRKGYLEGSQAKLVGIPRGMETSILAYKKDIFVKNNFTAPGSYVELKSLIKALSTKAKVPPMTARLRPGHHCVHSWLLQFNPMGGTFFDEQWRSNFNQPPGVEALDYLKLVADTGVPQLQQFGFKENQEEFITGKSAMYLDSTSIITALNLPEYASIKGNVAYALHPRGSRYASAMAGFACGISASSANKEAAFIFLQWLTNKEQDVKFTRLGVQSNRKSTLSNQKLLAEIPYLEILRKQLVMANPDWRPMIPQWDIINIDYMGKAIPRALNNEANSQKALNECATQVNILMKQWGYQS